MVLSKKEDAFNNSCLKEKKLVCFLLKINFFN